MMSATPKIALARGPTAPWSAAVEPAVQPRLPVKLVIARPGGVDLAATVSMALARHPDIGRAGAEIARSGGDLQVAESAWYPKVGYTSAFGKSSITTASSADNANLRAGLEVNQLIYDFGRADSQIQAARATRAQRSAEFADTEERVALATSDAYLELARAQSLLGASSRYLTALVNLRTTISIRADSGAANRADVHVAETRVQSAKAERIRSQTRYLTAQARLFQLTGAEITQAIAPTAVIARLIKKIESAPTAQGTGIAAAEQATDAARARLMIAQAAYYPAIGARAAYTRPFSNDATTATSTIGLTVTGDLFNGGGSAGRVLAAAGDLAAAERSTSLARLTSTTEVAVARAEIAGARDRTGTHERQLESARSARETSLAEYSIGKRTLTEVLNAEQEIFRAETDRINADSDANLAIIRAAAARQVLIACLSQMRVQSPDRM